MLSYRRDHFTRVGGFDTGYRNSFEDMDLCLKVRRTGGRIQLTPRARLTHLESQTPGRHDFDETNRQLFLATWGTPFCQTSPVYERGPRAFTESRV